MKVLFSADTDRVGGDVDIMAIDHQLCLADGSVPVGSDLSVWLHSLGGLISKIDPSAALAILNLIIHPTPAPAPTPAPIPTPTPTPTPAPAPVPSFDWKSILIGVLQILTAQPAVPVVPTPTPAPSPLPNPAPSPPKMMALPAEKRPSKEDVVNELKAKGVDVKMIPLPLLLMLINLGVQYGLPFLQGLISKFFPGK